jgi:hypothetical protein
MDDLVERLIDEADGYGDGPVVMHDIEGLRALLREAAAALEASLDDAERYQWLRECAWLHPEAAPACAIFGVDGSMLRSIDGPDLDAAIDQARGKEAP